MTFFLLVLLLVGVLFYIFWIIVKPGEKDAPKKTDHKNEPAKKNRNTELKQADQTSNIDPIRKKIADQLKNDPELISRAISYWLNQK